MKKKIFVLTFLMTIFYVSMAHADWVNDNVGYKYINNATNQYVYNNWVQTGGGYYYLDQNGYIVKGWYLINGKYYYFNNDGIMQVGFQELNGAKYYLDTNTGEMVTGWLQTYLDGIVEYYYFGNDGAMCIGWKEIDGKWYYFNDGKAIVDTWAKINGIWYHLNANGYMDTGWINTNGKMYHLNEANGSLTTGWIQDQYGNEYYLSEVDGSLIVNTTMYVHGVSCTFDEYGRCIAKNQEQGQGIKNYSTFFDAANTGTNYQTYGANVGVSPGQNNISGAITSSQQMSQARESLQAGDTTGPK